MSRSLALSCVAAVATLAASQASYATITEEAFLGTRNSLVDGSPLTGFTAGTSLGGSTAAWTGGTSGAATIAALAGPLANTSSDAGHSAANNLALRIDPGTTTKQAINAVWGGPGRNTTSPEPELNRAYFSIDIYNSGTGTYTGTDTTGAPMIGGTRALWSVYFQSVTNNKGSLLLAGGLNTVQMFVLNGPNPSPNPVPFSSLTVLYTGALITLNSGWNNICVLNDISAGVNPNVSMYKNTEFDANGNALSAAVDSYNATAGPMTATNPGTKEVVITRYNSSTTDGGKVYLDNILTADTFADLNLAHEDYMGWQTEQVSYDPTLPEPATLALLGLGGLILLRRR